MKEDPGSPGQVSLDKRSIIPYKWVKEKDMKKDGYIADKLKKAKNEDKDMEKRFFNSLLNMCVMNGMVDWSDKDPQKEFKELGELLIVYMIASGIEVEK